MESKKVYDGKFLDIFVDTYDNGKKILNWERCARKNDTKAVMIVPYHVEENKYIMIKEFRIPIKDYELGFPAGLIEKDESVENAIKREIKEETGLDLVHINKISPFTYSSSGMTDEAVSIAFVEVKGKLSDKFLEESEDIVPMFVSIDEINKLLNDQSIKWGSKAWLICNFVVEINKYFSEIYIYKK